MGPKHIAAVRIHTAERLRQLPVILYLERTHLDFTDILIFHSYYIIKILRECKVTANLDALSFQRS